MSHLSKKDRILVGLTIFSMFFGAGNLIFPPFLGNQSGTEVWTAAAGFVVTAVGFPILGIIALARAGGIVELARRVHPYFASVFVLLSYISIGPGLAIPRTASTSFEMAVMPFLSEGANVQSAQLIYSVVFFAAAFCIVLKPEKLTERLGKILTPCLLVLIVVIFAGTLMKATGIYGAAVESYETDTFLKGFLEGYQTMDAIAALNFGAVIAIGIRAKGVKEEKTLISETIKAGVIAGVLMLAVYLALSFIGASVSGQFQSGGNGAEILTYTVYQIFGKPGQILLGMIFVIACLNTCIGLICCCSEYFNRLMPKVPYVAWAVIFAVISCLISNLGLNTILSISVPILQMIYPLTLMLILLALIQPWIEKWKYVYPCSIFATGVTSVIYVLETLIPAIPGATILLHKLPLYEQGLVWILPAVIGLLAGILLSKLKREKS